jgi:hypothetical protein
MLYSDLIEEYGNDAVEILGPLKVSRMPRASYFRVSGAGYQAVSETSERGRHKHVLRPEKE